MWVSLLFAMAAIAFFFLWMRTDKRCRNLRKWYAEALFERDNARSEASSIYRVAGKLEQRIRILRKRLK